MGMFGTAGIIINNLMGGIDITRILTMPPPLPGHPYDDTAVREFNAARKRQAHAFLLFLCLLFVLVLIVIWPYLKKL